MTDIQSHTATIDALTPKQREVVALVAEGLTSKEIGRKLGISESAVNQRIETVRNRMGGLSRARIARLYRDTSMLTITIPTSNSLTGKSIQLQLEDEAGQQRCPEGADEPAAFATGHIGELQPSNLPSIVNGRFPRLQRLALVVAIAAGMLAVGVLILATAHALSEFAK